MQLKTINNFFLARNEKDFLKISKSEFDQVNCFCDDVFFAIEMMKKYALQGTLILPSRFALDKQKFEKFKHSGFKFSVFVDLLDDDDILNRVSLLKLPTTTLLYENLTRTGQISQKFGGKMPAQALEDLGFWDHECQIVGGMYADKDDLQILGEHNAKITICPRAFAEKGATFVNLKLLARYPVKLSLGTYDFPEVDLERELEFLRLTSCALFEDPYAVTIKELKKLTQGEKI